MSDSALPILSQQMGFRNCRGLGREIREFANSKFSATANSPTPNLLTYDFAFVMNSLTQYKRLLFRLLNKVAKPVPGLGSDDEIVLQGQVRGLNSPAGLG